MDRRIMLDRVAHLHVQFLSQGGLFTASLILYLVVEARMLAQGYPVSTDHGSQCSQPDRATRLQVHDCSRVLSFCKGGLSSRSPQGRAASLTSFPRPLSAVCAATRHQKQVARLHYEGLYTTPNNLGSRSDSDHSSLFHCTSTMADVRYASPCTRTNSRLQLNPPTKCCSGNCPAFPAYHDLVEVKRKTTGRYGRCGTTRAQSKLK